MFACIYCQSVSERRVKSDDGGETLIDLAFTFSPLVEQTSVDTIVLDIEGCELMFGAKPVFIDSELQTWNMDPVLLEQSIKDCIKQGKKPKAIIVVHHQIHIGAPYNN